MRLEHHLVGGYVRYISPHIIIIIIIIVVLEKHNCFSPPRSKWVPVRAELVVVFD